MSRRAGWCFCSLGLALTLSAVGFAGDKLASIEWPQWRGVHRDGISSDTGLLKKWPTGGPPLLWKADGIGSGYSSVSIADDKIFTLGDAKNPQTGAEEQTVFALRLDDGKILWQTPVGKSDEHQHGGARSTPTVDGDAVYVEDSYGEVTRLDAADGHVVWKRSLPDDFHGAMQSQWGFSESPLVDGDKVLCTPGAKDAAIVALNKKTGELIWKTALPELGADGWVMPAAPKGKDGAGYSSIVVSNAAGVKQYVQLIGRGCIGVRADDGKFLWGYNHVAGATANIPTPVVSGDYVFTTTGYGDGGSGLVKLSPSGKGVKAQEVYWLDEKKFKNHHGGVILVGDYLYGGHGQNGGLPTCLDFKTGRIVWQEKDPPGKKSATIAYADGNLYFNYEDGTIVLIEATPKGYHEKGSFKLETGRGHPSWSEPVVAGGKLYIREQNTLYCYNVKQ